MQKLPRSFYLRPTLTVTKDLLDKHLVRRIGRTRLIGKIVEVEAYLGKRDPASHAYRGLTKRNEVMFREGGHLYVYFTYGMHFCCNVVTEAEGTAGAALIRAIEPIEEIDVMVRNRGWSNGKLEDWSGKMRFNLTNGPAKLCEALGIGRAQNGTDLLGDQIYIARRATIPKSKIVSTTRVGIKNGAEKRWRFYIDGNPFVSKTG
jgi:DNA-3-methyladenine glycosylase